MKTRIRNSATNVVLATYPDETEHGPWYFIFDLQRSALRAGFDPVSIVAERFNDNTNEWEQL